MKQEEILLSLVQGKNGQKWADSRAGWKAGNGNTYEDDPCTWTGVSCESGVVIGVQVQGSNLMASIPQEFGMLTGLRKLDLSSNLIFGHIPQDVASLPNMEIYNISHNQVSGPLPRFASTNLIAIDLEDNRLTGTIPHQIGEDNPNMQNLNLVGNRLLGTIPESIGKMLNLVYLQLSENSLYGSLPNTLGYLSALEYLYVDTNRLVGEIPSSLASSNSILKEAWFQKNMLSGVVPPEFAEVKTLKEFYVDENKLTGYLPQDLCNPDLNKDFYDDYPEFFQIAGTTERDLCQSIACPPQKFGSDGIWPCFGCPADSVNPYLGQYGEVQGDACYQLDQADILRAFYIATSGDEWVGGNNWFFPGFDVCDFTGVTCNKEGHVIRLELPQMGLVGTIEESIGFLEHLEVLDLSRNYLEGFLPSDLRFAPLSRLDISDNFIKGIVPPKLCMQRINGNGEDGKFFCDYIACPEGTYSSTGNGYQASCKPCDDDEQFLGKVHCGPKSSLSSPESETKGVKKFGSFVGITLLVVLLAGFAFYLFGIYKKRNGRRDLITRDELESLDLQDTSLEENFSIPSEGIFAKLDMQDVSLDEIVDGPSQRVLS